MYKKFKSLTPLSGFYIVFYGSVMNEHKGIYGISHLMEHLVCKGIFPLLEDFERDSISWNAYTSDNMIVFYMTGLNRHVNKWKKAFYERIQDFNITEEVFQNEKKIVIEEYKDSFNNQGDAHILNLMRKLYNHYEAIGLLEDLENLTLKDCQDYFELQYRKPTMIVEVSQGEDLENDTFFNSIIYDTRDYKDKILEFNPNSNFIYEKGNTYNDKSSIINLSGIINDDFPKVDFICRMLGGGLKSPLYNEIREKYGLVYFFHCYMVDITHNSSVVVLSTETSNENIDKVQELISQVLFNPKQYMTLERFNITKEYYINRKEKEDILLYTNATKLYIPEQFVMDNILENLTYEDIMEVYYKYFDFSKFYISVDKKEFKKTLPPLPPPPPPRLIKEGKKPPTVPKK